MYSKEEIKDLKIEFWKKLENRTRRLPEQKGQVKKWIFDQTEIKGVDLRFDVNRNYAMVALEINHKDEDRRLKLFAKLDACKTLFETTFGDSLKWQLSFDKENGKNVCRVYKLIEADFHNREKWKEIIPFLIYNMLNMEKAFEEVKDFLKYDELGK
ncbi:MAG: DUF4268 domain-containing protein [Marinilabiliaceae bacterium]|nr:DUF4268 domain-containing protein [Marinilabiliaceae bacterium]